MSTDLAPHPALQDRYSPAPMCFYRKVRQTFARCRHVVDLPDEEIHCESPNCKFSHMHPPNCQPPMCKQTCFQYRQYPQQYTPQIDDFCPRCKLRNR